MLIAQISDPHVTIEGTAVRSLVDTPQRFADALATCAAIKTDSRHPKRLAFSNARSVFPLINSVTMKFSSPCSPATIPTS